MLKKRIDLNIALLISSLIAQLVFWFFISQKVKPDFTITPLPPSSVEIKFVSLGDDQFAYRMYGQMLQNAGDTFGETIPLKDYDFTKLQKWFFAIDALSKDSEYIPSIAASYYGQSQNVEDCKYVIDYLYERSERNPEKNWRWYLESIYLALYRMKDDVLAKRSAEKLLSLENKDIPIWAKFLVPFVMQKHGDVCGAYDLISKLNQEDIDKISNDYIWATRGGAYNPALKIIADRVELLKKNPRLVGECIRKAKERDKK